MKSRQAAKIRELGQSLIDAGFVTLDQTVRGAWAHSKHHLDHSESQPQTLRSNRRGHQPHVVVARASSARPTENSWIHDGQARRRIRWQPDTAA